VSAWPRKRRAVSSFERARFWKAISLPVLSAIRLVASVMHAATSEMPDEKVKTVLERLRVMMAS
jgi:hypothetical protein